MIFLVFIDTLDPVTHAVSRTGPHGWVSRSRSRDADFEARRRFGMTPAQALVLERTYQGAVKKIARRQATAVKRGADASFAACYEAMLKARKVVHEEERPKVRRMDRFALDALLPGL